MKYISQPRGAVTCGQTVLAMIFNMTIAEVCDLMGKHGRTRNKHLQEFLLTRGCTSVYSRAKTFEEIPNGSIVKIGFKGYSDTHWVLKDDNKYYDPDIGILHQYNTDFIEPISYMQVVMIP